MFHLSCGSIQVCRHLPYHWNGKGEGGILISDYGMGFDFRSLSPGFAKTRMDEQEIAEVGEKCLDGAVRSYEFVG